MATTNSPKEDIYNEKSRINSLLESLKKGKRYDQYSKTWVSVNILPKNVDYLFKFYDFLVAEGLSHGRIKHYMGIMRQLTEEVNKNWKTVTKEDIEKLFANVEKRNLSAHTKQYYRVSIRKFIKWLKDWNDPVMKYPPEVAWLKTSIKKSEEPEPLTEADLLTREDVDKMLSASSSPRERAYIMASFESGCRPTEIISLKVKNVEFKKEGVVFRIRRGKTGTRNIILVDSEPYLAEWKAVHPRNEPNAYFWLPDRSIETRAVSENILPTYESFAAIIKKLAHKAGLKKRIYPYLFRHSHMTWLAKEGFSTFEMEQRAGWVLGRSKMAHKYVHLGSNTANDAYLKKKGVIKDKKKEEEERPVKVTCNRCSTENTPDRTTCRKCGFLLDKKYSDSFAEYVALQDEINKETGERLKQLYKKVAKEVYSDVVKSERFKELEGQYV